MTVRRLVVVGIIVGLTIAVYRTLGVGSALGFLAGIVAALVEESI